MSSESSSDKLDRIVAEAQRNRELLCIYCHDNEHSRYKDSAYGDVTDKKQTNTATHNPFADLATMLKEKK
jgi:hypothetical protein